MTREARSGFGVVVSQGIDVIAQTIAAIAAARILGPERNGELVFALSTIGMLAVLAFFGSSEVAIRAHARNEAEPRAIWGAQLSLLTGGILVAALLAVAIGALVATTASARWALVAAVALLATNGVSSALQAVVQARDLAHRDVVNVALSRALLVGGVLSLGRLGPAMVLLAHLAAASTLVVLRGALVSPALGGLVPRHDRAVLARIWEGGRYVGLGSIFGGVAQRADVVLLSRLSGSEAVGLYGACYRLLNGVGAVAGAVAVASFPALTRRLAGGQRRSALATFAIPPLVIATCVAVAAPFADWIVVGLYGEEYAAAGAILQVLLAACVVQVATAFLHRALLAEGLERSLPAAQGTQALVNVALNVWLIPQYGALGAAFATLGCELVVPVVHAVVHVPVLRRALARAT